MVRPPLQDYVLKNSFSAMLLVEAKISSNKGASFYRGRNWVIHINEKGDK